jgi:dihydroflavonol-4-reductase
VRALVTGATGFVGSHVVDVLIERGIDVSYIARASSDHRWLTGKKVTLTEGSLYDLTSLRTALDGVDTIIHVAGQTAGKNEEDFRRGNEGVTQNLVDAVRAYRPNLTRFVHISSLAVTGPSPSLEKPVDEGSPLRPITAYGRTKKLAEDVMQQAMKEFPATIVRPPAVYGPRDTATLTFFQAVHRGIAPVIGFDDKYVSLVHIRDLARGIVDAALHEAAVGQTYFVATNTFNSWAEISTVTAAVSGRRRIMKIRIPHPLVLGIAGVVGFTGKLFTKPPVLDYEKGIDMIQKYWICSSDKAHRDLGYRQEISLADGILETVSWYREQGWL